VKRIPTICVLAASFLTAASPGFAQDSAPPPGVLTPEQRESVKQLTALFLITLIVVILMVAVVVILSILLRRRMREAAERKPQMPTELEDLWWRMNLPEEREEKKPPE